MGVVYLAVNEALDREVALKVLQTSFDEESEALARFRREAKLAARIEHPNVVGVYEVGKWQGRSFLAMQLVRGESLGDRLARKGALDAEEALRVIVQAAHGLAAAHTHQTTLFELALAHIKKPAPDVRESVPETPEAQALLIARMLSKDPAGRPRDAMALLAELEQMSLE